jgi:hypothetical protein
MQHTITHQDLASAYWAGYELAKQEIAEMGWSAARDKFNLDNPLGSDLSMPAYYYAKGQMQALLQFD